MRVAKIVCDRCYDVIGDFNNRELRKKYRFKSSHDVQAAGPGGAERYWVVTDLCRACQPHLDDNFSNMSVDDAEEHLLRIGARWRHIV